MKFALKTLGCKVNQAESDLFYTSVLNIGWEMVSFQDRADVYVINSCAVTREAERKTGQYVRRALRTNPEARVFLTGCLARRIKLDGSPPVGERVEILASTHKLEELLSRVEACSGRRPEPAIAPSVDRARVWIKLQDGCDHFCSYCIVPRLRGPVDSRLPADILRSILLLEEAGYREVVLCGINLGYYGKDRDGLTLIDLLELLVRSTRRVRFRLSSLEPFAVAGSFFDRYFDLAQRVCPHVHLPLQSGSDQVLALMNRGYTTRDFSEIVDQIRRIHPLAAITTDLMVGFPGETDLLFQESLDFFKNIGFSRTHLFIFSPRPGTPACDLERTRGIPRREKKLRETILRQWAVNSQTAYQEQFLGKTVSLLVETVREGVAKGHSDTYLDIQVPGVTIELGGEIVDVLVETIEEGVVIGRLME